MRTARRAKTRRTLDRGRSAVGWKPTERPWEEGGVNGSSRREIELPDDRQTRHGQVS